MKKITTQSIKNTLSARVDPKLQKLLDKAYALGAQAYKVGGATGIAGSKEGMKLYKEVLEKFVNPEMDGDFDLKKQRKFNKKNPAPTIQLAQAYSKGWSDTHHKDTKFFD